MAVHNGGLIGKLLELGGADVSDDIIEQEETLPDEIFNDDRNADPPPEPSMKISRPLSKMRAIEAYLERKRLQEWLDDPLDDSAY